MTTQKKVVKLGTEGRVYKIVLPVADPDQWMHTHQGSLELHTEASGRYHFLQVAGILMQTMHTTVTSTSP